MTRPAGTAESANAARAMGVAQAGRQVEVRAGTPLATPSLVPEAASRPSAALAATFNVTYTGFTPAARTAFQRAVNLWAPLVTSSVPITVAASFEPLGAGILGSAGPSSVWRDFTGAPRPRTWYVDALANKRFGSQLNASPDIMARFSSSFTNWHFGSAAAPAGKYDFTSVVLHELGHGLGFLGAGTVSGGLGSVRLSGTTPKFPIAYDRFTENAAGTSLLSFPDNSTQLATQLRSNNVFFDSPGVRTANGGQPARLYAPSTWQQGSSYSHLNEATYTAGNVNSLMTPQIGSGETIRNPGPITRALFTTIGW